MKPIIYLFTAGLLLIASQVYGQTLVTNLSPATVTAPIGNTVNLQLKVTNFNNVNSIQFPITFNASVLKFDSIFNSTLPGFNNGNYFVPSAGKIVVTWFPDPGSYPNGFSVPDNSSIFTLRFTVLTNGMSPVNLANTPPGIEAFADNAPLTVNYQTGGSTVTGGSGAPPLQGFHIIANTIYIPQGMTGCMPVTVHDFNDIISMQYAMHWDKTILEFENTQGYNLPDLTAGSFGGDPANGLQLLAWSDPQALGVDRANGTKIYDVCFKAIGAPGTSSLVTINGTGFPPGSGTAEAFNAASQNVWTNDSGVTDTIFVVTGQPSTEVTITADKDTVGVGGLACVDYKVKNFNSVISMQFGITYDSTKIQFQSIQLMPNPLGLSGPSNFNTSTSGQIVFTWNDATAMGQTLPDNTKIFSVCFTAAAPVGTLVDVKFSSLSNPPLPIEIAKEPDGPITPVLNNGHVFISDVVPTVNISTTGACGGANVGTATATVFNGTASTYSWSGPAGPISGSQQTISGLAPGAYNVMVILTNGDTIAGGGSVVNSNISIPTPQLIITNVRCNGENNGSIELTVTGGADPYTYSWSGPGGFTADTENVDSLAPGLYTLLVTDASGCSFTSQPYTVSQPGVLTASLVSSQNVACFGTNSGKAEISVSGGTPTYSYSWKSIPDDNLVSIVKNPTDLPPGTVNVTVTDSRGCTATLPNPVSITGPSSALAVATPIEKVDVICYGANQGEINLEISGGWSGNYTVNWNPVVPGGANPENIPAGIYTATVTDQGGCTLVTQQIAINQPPAITPGDPVVEHLDCHGDGDGSINIQVSGGNGGPHTVNWAGGLAGETISALAGGDYIATVTDGIGCTFVLPAITVNEPDPIQYINEDVTIPDPGMSNGAVSLDISGGTAPYTISWTGPNFTSDDEDIANLAAGDYTLMVTDANGCSFSKTYEVKPPFSFAVTTTASCGNDGCLNLVIAGGVPPFTVSWTGTASGSGFATDNTISICTFKKGVYNVTVADNASNVFTINSVVVDGLQAALVSTTVTPPNLSFTSGSILLTPVPDTVAMTYDWTGPNGFDFDGNHPIDLDSGLYIVTVTNTGSGCTAVYSFALWPPLASSANQVVNPNCNNTANGSITLNVAGGNPPYTFNWAGPGGFTATTQNLTGLNPGAYTVTVTDELDSLKITTITLTAQSQLAITNVNELSNYQGFQVSGANECDGIANVVISGASGAASILWSNGVTTAMNETLCAGDYSVVVTDALGCTASWSDNLTSPPGIAPTTQIVSSLLCHGDCDGVARVFVSGGIQPYTVKWSTGQTDQLPTAGSFSQAVNLCGGDYTVTITDKLGATQVYTVEVPEPAPITIVFDELDPQSLNSCDGELIATAINATEPFTYTWSGSLGHSGDGQRAERLCAGEIVQFIIEDANGCIGIASDTLGYPTDGCYQVRPVLTPGDQDGNNDFTFITCIEAVPNSIEIYNRWGQLVFETTGYDNGVNVWTGTNKNGQPLAEGVYFYVLTYTDPILGVQQQKGHINLLR